jgi:hypothetical protein
LALNPAAPKKEKQNPQSSKKGGKGKQESLVMQIYLKDTDGQASTHPPEQAPISGIPPYCQQNPFEIGQQEQKGEPFLIMQPINSNQEGHEPIFSAFPNETHDFAFAGSPRHKLQGERMNGLPLHAMDSDSSSK